MSAIAGIVNFNKEPVKIEEIHSVMGALQKFPADDIQVWKNENVFFGCHAQWITPESLVNPFRFMTLKDNAPSPQMRLLITVKNYLKVCRLTVIKEKQFLIAS